MAMAWCIQNSPLSITPIRISTTTARRIYEASKADIERMEKEYFDGVGVFTELYKTLNTTDFDDTLSVSRFTKEQVVEYLLYCLHALSKRAMYNYKSEQKIKSRKPWKIALFFQKVRQILIPSKKTGWIVKRDTSF
jgi:hypothetical protein